MSTFRLAGKAVILTLLILIIACDYIPESQKYYEIRVVDSETGRGIPLVQLESLNKASYITDSQGYIAYYEPGLMGEKVYFLISSEGYDYPKDITGRSAITLDISAGASTTITMRRVQPAERIYRTTGHGIYRESVLLGQEVPIDRPLLNAKILGQDSNIGVKYKGNIFWIWGDTFLPPAYDGNFSVAAATSLMPDAGGLDPDIGVNYNYFTDENGASRSIIVLEKPGYVWYEWLMNIPDDNGVEQLVAKYSRVGGQFQNYERGVALFNDETEMFEKLNDSEEWIDSYSIMHHPFKGKYGDQEHYYLTSEFQMSRVPIDVDLVGVPSAYESFTCLRAGSKYDLENLKLDRDLNGNLIYGWKKNTDEIDMQRQKELIENGLISQNEGWIQLLNVITHEPMSVHRGSIFWNEFRQKWILIAGGSDDYAGDILYSEADTPVGPWGYAAVVAYHDNMYYNPTQHPFFDKDGGQTIFFEGTYTNFWGQGSTKAYYDYNQLMYKLDLKREEVMLPEPVYQMQDGDLKFGSNIREEQSWDRIEKIAFFAYPPNHHPHDLIPINKTRVGTRTTLSLEGNDSPFMYALPANIDHSRNADGEWDCSLKNHEAIDNYLPLNISHKNGRVQVTTKSRSMSVTEAQLVGDELKLNIMQYGKDYMLRGSVIAGKINGDWESADSKYKGTWEGESISKQWLPQFNTSMFSIKNKSDEVCHVWENPFDQPIFDWNIAPK